MRIALLLFITASLAYADERADYIARLPKADILKTLEHLSQLTKDAQAERDAAVQSNEFVTQKLVIMQQSNEEARQQVATIEKEQEALRAWGTEQQAEAQKQEARADKEAKLAKHKANIVGTISAIAIGLIGVVMMRFIPPPYSLIAPIVLAPVGFVLGRFFL